MFRKSLDNTRQSSLANKFRQKRFKHFNELIKGLPAPIKILDIGGTENFWQQMGLAGNENFRITVLNINKPICSAKANMIFVKGDASDLSEFPDKSFDIVFSNSVIEHIPETQNRVRMAEEIKRVGVKYFVQTPNYYFPFEPHFLFPFFQFFPQFFKITLLKSFNMGWFKKCKNNREASILLKENQLLRLKELKNYFPEGKIIKERFLFMNKSFIAVK